MPRRRSLLIFLVAAVGAALSVVVVIAPPAFVWGLFVEERPSVVAGDAVPPVAEPPLVRIAIAGDTGTGDAAIAATVARMVVQSRFDPYDALVLLGDLIYEDGDAQLTHRLVLEPFGPVLDGGAVLIPALGNHDYDSDEQQEILRLLGRDSAWYVQRVGPVRVVVLDSNQVSNPQQTQWLRNTLAMPTEPGTWTVAAMHEPAYSAGYHGSNLAQRRAWSPLFAAANVPLVLAGHDHDYQRSFPQQGVTYVVSGAAAKLTPVDHQEFTAVSASTLHYLDLLVYDDRLIGRAIDQSGKLVDLFTIRR